MCASPSAPGDSAIPGSGSAPIISKTLTIFSPLAPLSNECGALTVLSHTRTPVGISFHFLYPWALLFIIMVFLMIQFLKLDCLALNQCFFFRTLFAHWNRLWNYIAALLEFLVKFLPILYLSYTSLRGGVRRQEMWLKDSIILVIFLNKNV